MATTAQRQHLAASMRFLLAHEPQVHYAQVRPMRTIGLSEAEADTLLTSGHGLTMDCSESVTVLCKWAGLRDPNGLGYDGSGYTGTLLGHLPHYGDPRGAAIGALAVFGPAPGDHVAMVLRPDPVHADPVLFSHGSERGPLAIRLSTERAYHRPPVTMLSIAAL